MERHGRSGIAGCQLRMRTGLILTAIIVAATVAPRAEATAPGASDVPGPVVSWGNSSDGQATPPAAVDGTAGTATAIAAGYWHTLAIAAPAPDADGDGVLYAGDNCPSTPNPDQAEADGDGVGDACDDCTADFNPDQRDTNGDGFGNACDADVNGDGVVNFADLSRMKQRFFQPPGPSALAP